MRVHFVVNVRRADAVAAAEETAGWLHERGVTVAVEPEAGRDVALEVVQADHFGNADLVVAFGGDGTLIRAAHLSSATGTPVLGVYYGRFGFVTQCLGSEVRACVLDFIEGRSKVESRMMLEAVLMRGHREITTLHSLNEVVLQRDVSSHMMMFAVEVDGNQLTTYPADGVMVASPTGSTAYNLSAGGPIVDPRIEALLLTAIAPHTLADRTLVLSPTSEVGLTVCSSGDAVLSADGMARLHLLTGDEVRVKRSRRVTNLVGVEKNDFLLKLGQRLQWSQGMVSEGR